MIQFFTDKYTDKRQGVVMDKWDKRFMNMAYVVASWSSCYKENRQVGAVIVRDKRILTTGYNGASSGLVSCKEKGECLHWLSLF